MLRNNFKKTYLQTIRGSTSTKTTLKKTYKYYYSFIEYYVKALAYIVVKETIATVYL